MAAKQIKSDGSVGGRSLHHLGLELVGG